MHGRSGLLSRLLADSVLPCALAALALLAALIMQRTHMLDEDARVQATLQLERLAGTLANDAGGATQALLDQALRDDSGGALRRIEWRTGDGRLLSSGIAPAQPSRFYQRRFARPDGITQSLLLQVDPRPLQRALQRVWLSGALCAAGIVLLAALGRWSLRYRVIDPLSELEERLDALLAARTPAPATPAKSAEFVRLQATASRLADLLAAQRRDWESIQRSSASDALDQQRTAQAATRSKSQFMALVGHHFRQPLQALQLLTAGLHPGIDEEQRSTLVQMRASIGRMTQLLDALLEISRLDAGVVTASPLDFNAAELFLRDRHALLEEARRHGVSLHWRGSQHRLHGDPELAADLLYQLAANAIAHAPGGRVLIAARCGRRGVRIDVRDNGEGIASIHQQRIFNEFVQLHGGDSRRDGYGLGLTIASRLAGVLGTRIDLRSAPGRGSTFRFTLPRPLQDTRSAGGHGRRQLRLSRGAG